MKLAHGRARYVRLAVLITALAVLVGIVLYTFSLYRPQDSAPQQVPSPLISAHVREATLQLEVVKTLEAQRRGLSGRSELLPNHGMLFVYDRDDWYGFWMPDMHFSIDIVWLDSLMRIVHIEESVSPESYPMVFRPDVPARYVLEVPVGWVKENSIMKGDTLVVTGE